RGPPASRPPGPQGSAGAPLCRPLGPVVEREQDLAELVARGGQRVAAVAQLDGAECAQLGEPLVEAARRDVVAGLPELAERPWPRAELPQHAQRPPAPEHLQDLHHGAAGPRGHGRNLTATISVAQARARCYRFRSTTLGRPSMIRIPPLAPPYAAAVAEDLEKLMPPGIPPIGLFRTLAHNPRVLRRVRKGGLLDPGA